MLSNLTLRPDDCPNFVSKMYTWWLTLQTLYYLFLKKLSSHISSPLSTTTHAHHHPNHRIPLVFYCATSFPAIKILYCSLMKILHNSENSLWFRILSCVMSLCWTPTHPSKSCFNITLSEKLSYFSVTSVIVTEVDI